ncbi:MAG TPA: phosphorylated adapter RNA export RNA-binding domain-containing protein [Roseiflexaceae bacterium]|nr:phosphorylated adapter RNA export RNA-binding domain-containing protein [Roseiflexaceae bacterium]HMP40897.1 phosphorylated adapter RNA export RNA-binding domain-containing protein [Roseiflexaceae bacterium]
MHESREIADALGETDPQPVALIKRIVRRLGIERVAALLAATRQIEANGGMPTRDGRRRRTAGGVFFELVKQSLRESGDADALAELFPPRMKPAKKQRGSHHGHQQAHVVQPAGSMLRPRRRVTGRAAVPEAAPAAPEQSAVAAPAETDQRVDGHAALTLAWRYLPREIGCYAIGAHDATRRLLVRFHFPDVARRHHAAALAAVAAATGWAVEVHPEPHQGQLAAAALALMPPDARVIGVPSIRFKTHQVVVRYAGTIDPAVTAVIHDTYQQQTGWELVLHYE